MGTHLAQELALDVVLSRNVAAELDSKVRSKHADIVPQGLHQLALLPDVERSFLLLVSPLDLERIRVLGAEEPSVGIREIASEVRNNVGRHAFEFRACWGGREEERGTERG